MKIGKLYGYWFNENEKPGGRKGWGIRHGRAFLHFGELFTLSWTWNLWRWSCALKGTFGMQDTYEAMLHVALPPVSLFFTVESHKLLGWLPDYPRQVGVAVHHGSIWFDIWSKQDEWNSKDPWWMQFTITPMDLIFGRSDYHERTIEDGIPVKIPMPEKCYEGTVKIFESTWKRPRSPFTLRAIRTTVDVPGGIPVPGKGTTSYNCGEDAIYAETAQHSNAVDAVAELVKSALQTRKRYSSGFDWVPEKMRKQEGPLA